nr:hypothetical protein [Clostridioides difficile]
MTPYLTNVVTDPNQFTPLDGEYKVQIIMTNAMYNFIGLWGCNLDHTS